MFEWFRKRDTRARVRLIHDASGFAAGAEYPIKRWVESSHGVVYVVDEGKGVEGYVCAADVDVLPHWTKTVEFKS